VLDIVVSRCVVISWIDAGGPENSSLDVSHHAGVPTVYREFAPPPGLDAHVACLWYSHDRAARILPDACVDIVFGAGQLVVAGPATAAADVPATPGQGRYGVRFRIGSAGAALGVPAHELLDTGVPLEELWGRAARRLEGRIAAAGSDAEALAALIGGVGDRLPGPRDGDPLVRRAAVALVRDGVSLPHAGRIVGLGERQLRRRFERAVGYGPATLVRIQRFQRFLSLAERDPQASIARLAFDAGYADQAHLTRECGRLSGVSPATLLRDGPMAAGEKSVSFNPHRSKPERLSA
jgi:AraC-like DNA-binding protein